MKYAWYYLAAFSPISNCHSDCHRGFSSSDPPSIQRSAFPQERLLGEQQIMTEFYKPPHSGSHPLPYLAWCNNKRKKEESKEAEWRRISLWPPPPQQQQQFPQIPHRRSKLGQTNKASNVPEPCLLAWGGGCKVKIVDQTLGFAPEPCFSVRGCKVEIVLPKCY